MSEGESAAELALPRALASPPGTNSSLIMTLALLGAGLIHLFLLLAVSFEMPKPSGDLTKEESFEILILPDNGTLTESPAEDAALSQRSRAGESPEGDSVISVPDGEDPPELTAPDPALAEVPPLPEPDPKTGADPEPPGPQPEPEPPAPEPPEPEPELAPEPVTPDLAPPEVLAVTVPSAPDPLDVPVAPAVNAAQILGSRNTEIARLTADLEARAAAYASRQRRRSVSASTKEFRYASYLSAWARKVERIGNLNYPQEAKEQGLFGNLILHVAIKADGAVEKIRVVRSSGHDLLDQAAIRIVELGAPYSPFPPDIAAETDVLDIVRTWQFLRGGRLGWER